MYSKICFFLISISLLKYKPHTYNGEVSNTYLTQNYKNMSRRRRNIVIKFQGNQKNFLKRSYILVRKKLPTKLGVAYSLHEDDFKLIHFSWCCTSSTLFKVQTVRRWMWLLCAKLDLVKCEKNVESSTHRMWLYLLLLSKYFLQKCSSYI